MAKFKVKVRIFAECEYTVEVDRPTERKAEEEAIGQWREQIPPNFQISKSYITNWETEAEQLTAICPDCSTEHSVPTAAQPNADCWYEDQDYCKPCGAKIEAEEKSNG